MPFTVPGIGYAGLGQQTAAAQQVFRQAMGGAKSAGTRRTRRSARSTPKRSRRTTRKASSSRSRSKAAKFVKGSVAARRHMAKLRKMRRR